MEFIGGRFLLNKGLVTVPEERYLKLSQAIQEIMGAQEISAFLILSILGQMASMLQVVPLGRLYMRPVQLYLLHYWRPSKRDIHAIIPVNSHLKHHLAWWLSRTNVLKGVSLTPSVPQLTVTTDASLQGWGGVCSLGMVQGIWSPAQRKLHINLLEMEAVRMTLRHFRIQIQGKHVLIRSDSMTVVTYINKMGGTKSPSLCIATWHLFRELETLSCLITATHIAGIQNKVADSLSRHMIQPTEWTLDQRVVSHLFSLWERPLIDLFASDHNFQIQTFCSCNRANGRMQ